MPPRKKVKKRNAIKPRQRKLIKAIQKGATITEAGHAAGYSHPNAASRAYKTIRLRFHSALEEAGLDVGKELVENYNFFRTKRDTAAETKFFADKGVVIEQREVIAHDIQLRAGAEINRILAATGERNDEREEDHDGRGPRHISLTMVVNQLGDAKVFMEQRPGSSADHKQLVLDVEPDEDSRRPGSDPEL